MENPVGWFEIYVDDLDKARTFYEGTLALELTPLESPMANLKMLAFPADMEKYGASGAICKMDQVQAGGNSTMVYFACDDCQAPAGRVTEHGGTLVAPKMPIGQHGFIAIAQDPDGNTIGFHSMA